MNLLVVDDHPIFLKGLEEILNDELPFLQVLAYKSSFAALANVAIHQPIIAILDLDMPEMNGIALAEALKFKIPTIKIIILTMHKEADIIRSVIAKGIDGFVFKDDAVNELTKAIKIVLNGGNYICDKSILNQTNEKSEFLKSLTKTEINVLKYIVIQNTSKEIAEKLSVSVKTVENHRNNISKKLQLKGSNSLVKFALSNKIYF